MRELIDKFASVRITVIGDAMLDRYRWGQATRISPEAPVPIVKMSKESMVPGGAANTAVNIATLGGRTTLVSAAGNDSAGERLSALLRDSHVDCVLVPDARPTIEKTRIMAGQQQVVRLDREDKTPLGIGARAKLIEELTKAAAESAAIVISDYAKGTLSEEVLIAAHAAASSRRIPLICDGKPEHADWFKGCTLITPNKAEAYAMAQASAHEPLEAIGQRLVHTLHCNVLITLSEQGMALFELNGKMSRFPAQAREVFDVSGAGDTVVACLALALGARGSLSDAVKLANIAAGIVVGKLGTASCSADELRAALETI